MPDERRAIILRAAQDLFSGRPYAEVSVADIAVAAGVSPPLIVFHYGSKRSLYLAVLDAAAGAIRAGLSQLPGPPSLERLRAGVRFYAGDARAHRAGFLSLLRGGQDVAEAAALVEAFRDELAAQIHANLGAPHRGGDRATDALTHRGRDRATDALTLLAVRGYLGYVDAVIVHWLALPEDQQDLVSADMIADVAAGAFSGGLSVIS